MPSNDVQPTDGTTPLVLQSLSYFSVVDGATLIPGSVNVTTNPTHGSVTIDPATGNITYTAAAGFAGTDSVGFTVADSDGLTSLPAYVSEIVTLPVALPATATTETGVAKTIAVLTGASSAAAPIDPTTVAVPTAPGHGTVSISPTTGAITYTSAAGFTGTDTFTYTVKDTNGIASVPATVSVVVDQPQAPDVTVSTPENTAVVIPITIQIPPSDSIVTTLVSITGGPSHGTATLNPATNAITYTPAAGFTGTDTLTYSAVDGSGAVSNTATVVITVLGPTNGTHDVVNPIAARTDAGTPVAVDVLSVDSSPVGLAPGTVTVQTAPANGTTAVNPTTGAITYTPAAGFTGTDSFTYSVDDNNNTSAGTATVTILVTAPRVIDTTGVTGPGQSVVIPVLTGDNNVDNAILPGSVTIVDPPAHGTTTVDPATGDVTYTADATFAGVDSFTYTATDTNHVVSNPARVTIISDQPGASDEFGTTDSGFPISIDVTANASDPAGSAAIVPSSVTILSGPSNGTATIAPDGTITYKSVFGFNGTDTMTYTIADNTGAVSNVGTITIVVNRPTATPDSATTPQNTPVVIDVAANDSDPDGNQFLVPTSITVTTEAAHGTVSVSGAGVVTYTPTAGFVGTDTFAYTIADAHGAISNPAVDTVTVTPAAAPVAANVAAAQASGTTPVTINLLSGVTQPAGASPLDPTTLTIVTQPADGTVTVDTTTGVATYTANGTFSGTDTFTYTVANKAGAVSNPATVTVPVLSLNQVHVQVAAASTGGGPQVNIYNLDGSVRASLFAYDPSFTGGVRVATGDLSGTGIPDIVTGPGTGGGPNVKVFNGTTGAVLASFFAFEPTFTGGVSVAVGDVTGAGYPDIIVGAGPGGGPAVKVFDGKTFAPIASFFAFDPSFRGGVSVAVGDLNGSGVDQIVVGAGPGGGPVVNIFNGAGQGQGSFFAFDPSFRGGVNVAVGDPNGSGVDQIVVGAGAGGGPQVDIVDGQTLAIQKSFFAYDASFTGGVQVATGFVNANAQPAILVGPGSGATLPVLAFDPSTLSQIATLNDPFGDFQGGVYVGGS
nr:Ig-like domain-containing protein [Fimbriiglobus ruber]